MKNSIKLPANYSCISTDEQSLIKGGRRVTVGNFFGNLIYDLLRGFNINFGKGISLADVNIFRKNSDGTNTGYTKSSIWESLSITGKINLGTLFADLFYPRRRW